MLAQLDGQQRMFIYTNLDSKLTMNDNEVSTPFLHMKAKVHKLSPEEIQNKDASGLRFRPIVDQSWWILKEWACLLREILEVLNKQFANKFSFLENVITKNIPDAADTIRNIKFKEQTSFKLIYSADLSDTYSNTFLLDLEEAVEAMGNILDLSAW